MSLVKHAETELKLAGLFDEDSDYGGALGEATLELVKLFAKQGHSGMSASMVRNLFHKLADYQPLRPLTLEHDEFHNSHGDNTWQNKRKSSVFKNGANGKPYLIDAYYCKNQDGHTYSTSVSIGDGTRIARCYIKDSKNMPEICIDVIDWEVNKETGKEEKGSGWWLHKMKDPKQLDKLKKYYDLEIVDENK